MLKWTQSHGGYKSGRFEIGRTEQRGVWYLLESGEAHNFRGLLSDVKQYAEAVENNRLVEQERKQTRSRQLYGMAQRSLTWLLASQNDKDAYSFAYTDESWYRNEDERLADYLRDAAAARTDLLRTRDELSRRMTSAIETFASAERYLRGGSGMFNELGLLQGEGPRIDLLAGLFRERVNRVLSAEHRLLEELDRQGKLTVEPVPEQQAA